jgi:hypothetical protein
LNPAATGSAITMYAVGEGPFTLSNGYVVTTETPAVFIDGFYCNGIAAIAAPVNGLPGNVCLERRLRPIARSLGVAD